MARPIRNRRVFSEPEVVYFKPAGVPMRELEEVTLAVEELEALRLCDAEEINQKEASEKMNISQPTFHRLISSARKKIAKALTKGNAIRIEGGNFEILKQGGFKKWKLQLQ